MIENMDQKLQRIQEGIRYKLKQTSGSRSDIVYIEGDKYNLLEGLIKYSLGRKYK